MSNLAYNGITIGLTKTLGISHDVVRDVDETYLYTRVRIDVEGIVNGPPTSSQNPVDLSGINSTISQGPVSDMIRQLRHALLQERGLLVYNVGDSPTPMIVSPGLDGNGNLYPCDANNGPVPGPLHIIRVDGIKTFHIRYSVTTCLIECPGYNGEGGPSGLISNRSSQVHSIDGSTFLTAITTTGQAFFRTDILEAAGQIADGYRDVLLPPIPRGFKRMAIQIQATPARNALSYTCTDQERFFDMGDTGPTGSNSNITDIDARYSVASTGQGGAPVSFMTAHSVRVQIKGSKAATTWTLVKAAFNVAQSKLPIGDLTKGFLTQIAVDVGLTDRSVSLQATMLLSPQAGGMIPGINNVDGLRANNVFAPQGGLNPPFPGRGGTAGTYTNQALTTAWKSACQGPTKPVEGSLANANYQSNYSNNTGPIVTATITPDLPTYTTSYSRDTTQFPFTSYKIDAVIETNTYIQQAAVTGIAKAASAGLGPTPTPTGTSPTPTPTGTSPTPTPTGTSPTPTGTSPTPTSTSTSPTPTPTTPTPTSPTPTPTSPTPTPTGTSPDDGDDDEEDDTPTCEFLTLAYPTQRKIVEWSAERVGASPIIPHPDPLDPNLVLIEKPHIQLAEPNLLTDGVTLAYSARGRYVYGLKKALPLTAAINYPAPPWQTSQYGQQVLPSDAYRDGIIDTVQSGNTPTPTGTDSPTPTGTDSPTPTGTDSPTPTPTVPPESTNSTTTPTPTTSPTTS